MRRYANHAIVITSETYEQITSKKRESHLAIRGGGHGSLGFRFVVFDLQRLMIGIDLADEKEEVMYEVAPGVFQSKEDIDANNAVDEMKEEA